MKKAFFALISVLSLLLLATSPVLAAPLGDGVITLEETRNDRGGGVIFVLSFTGDFPASFFKGFVIVGDEKYPIDCNVVADGLVQCTSSRAMAGMNVTLYVGDFIFYTYVPESSGPLPTALVEYCYPVYDLVFEPTTEEYSWQQISEVCQSASAIYGDLLDMGDDYPYLFEFLSSSPSCFNSVHDDAYYGACPQ